MTNILFGTAIGIWMVASIWGVYCWMVCRRHMLRPSRKVRDLVDEYARLKAEFRHVDTERGEGREIWDRMGAIDLELLELGYVLHETGKAAWVFPFDDYYVATFGEAPAQAAGDELQE